LELNQAMKRNATVLVLLLGAANLTLPISVRGDESQLGFNVFAPARTSTEWRYNASLWEQISPGEPALKISVGRGELAVRGALIETFRRPRNWSDLSLGEKIIHFPIINLFVPAKMPRPPGGIGRYFAWGETPVSWTVLAGGGVAGEAGTLLSIGW
jgi:hypothetical protein